METKRGRPRKNPTPEPAARSPAPPSFDGHAVRQIKEGLNQLALSRDYIVSLQAGEDPQEMIDGAREMLSAAGAHLERGLCRLGVLPEGTGSGWFVPELNASAVA